MNDEQYAWYVKGISEDFYWDNRVVAVFGSMEEALEYSEHLGTLGMETKVRRAECTWGEVIGGVAL